DRFWKAYAADRYNILTGGTYSGGGRKTVAGESSAAAVAVSSPAKYMVFVPSNSGLGNHLSGLMSTFVLSIATGRVFLHDWNEHTSQCGATYSELFVPPFEPWSALHSIGYPISGPLGLLPLPPPETREREEGVGGWRGRTRRSGKGGGVEEGGGGGWTAEVWGGARELYSKKERKRCLLDLTQRG
ncbi:unnamed protein product, partial [Laminaria digitata]